MTSARAGWIAVALLTSFTRPTSGQSVTPPPTELRVLGLQKAIDRTIDPGQVHGYRIDVRGGDYVQVDVIQSGIDVVLNVKAPGGRAVGEFDSPTGSRGPEPVRFIADAPGSYALEARTAQPEGERGSYTIRFGARRPSTATDRRVCAAVRAQQEADRLRAAAETRRQSLAAYDGAAELWRRVPDAPGEAGALRAKGFAHVRLGEDDRARAVFDDLRRRWRALRDRRAEAYTLLILGTILRREGQLENSLPMDEAARPLWRQAGDREQEAFTVATLATTYTRLGHVAKGERLHEDALRIARRAGSVGLEAAMWRSLANARQQGGDTTGALRAHARSLALWKQLGHRRGQAGILMSIAAIHEAAGDRAAAIDALGRAATLWEEVRAAVQAADARRRLDALR